MLRSMAGVSVELHDKPCLPKEGDVSERLVKTKKLPKQARARARVEAILSATRSLVTSVAPEEITTTAIARKADVPVGSVYQYFEDRTDILQQLYSEAYEEVTTAVADGLSEYEATGNFEDTVRAQLYGFWQVARAHPTFRALTRWANNEFSFHDIMPDAESSLQTLIENSLKVSGITFPEGREKIVLEMTTLLVSVLVDAAIEQDDDEKAASMIGELATIIARYLA